MLPIGTVPNRAAIRAKIKSNEGYVLWKNGTQDMVTYINKSTHTYREITLSDEQKKHFDDMKEKHATLSDPVPNSVKRLEATDLELIKAFDTLMEVAPPLFVFIEETKISQIYYQMHLLAALNPTSVKEYTFVDDRDDILQCAFDYFQGHPEQVPTGMVINFEQRVARHPIEKQVIAALNLAQQESPTSEFIRDNIDLLYEFYRENGKLFRNKNITKDEFKSDKDEMRECIRENITAFYNDFKQATFKKTINNGSSTIDRNPDSTVRAMWLVGNSIASDASEDKKTEDQVFSSLYLNKVDNDSYMFRLPRSAAKSVFRGTEFHDQMDKIKEQLNISTSESGRPSSLQVIAEYIEDNPSRMSSWLAKTLDKTFFSDDFAKRVVKAENFLKVGQGKIVQNVEGLIKYIDIRSETKKEHRGLAWTSRFQSEHTKGSVKTSAADKVAQFLALGTPLDLTKAERGALNEGSLRQVMKPIKESNPEVMRAISPPKEANYFRRAINSIKPKEGKEEEQSIKPK